MLHQLSWSIHYRQPRDSNLWEILNLFNEDKIGGTSELQSPRLLNQSHLKLEAKLEESSE